MISDNEIRLKLVETVIAQASRVGLEQPETVVKICTTLEKYVIKSPKKAKGKSQPSANNKDTKQALK